MPCSIADSWALGPTGVCAAATLGYKRAPMPTLAHRPQQEPGKTPRPLAERVTADFRRAVVFGILAVTAYGVSRGFDVHSVHRSSRIVAYCTGAAFVLLGVLAVRSLANELARIVRAHAGSATATSLRVLVLIVGYVAVLLFALDVFAVPVGNLLLGGAVTGIILGIAAQQALGNVFAGFVLLVARPYVPGQRVRVVSGALGRIRVSSPRSAWYIPPSPRTTAR